MAFDAQGNHSLPDGTIVSTGDKVLPSQHNPAMLDLSASLSAVLKKDGRDGMVGILNMGSFEITNVATSQTATSAATVGQLQSSSPIGLVADFAGSTAPAGWLLCYGQAVSRVTYAALFAVIGTTFGTGDGATTFNVPDLRGRVTAGRDDMGGTDAARLSGVFGAVAKTIGGVLGAAAHLLTIPQMPSHFHGPGSLITVPHTHPDILVPTRLGKWDGSGSDSTRLSVSNPEAAATGLPVGIPQAAGLSLVGTSASSGGAEAHPNAQPSMILNKIIKASY